jgi:glycosyltransferase involved in cell wall biosynthesis
MHPPRPSYDLIGFLGHQLGIAVAARNSLRVLSATGRLGEPVSVPLPTPSNVAKRLLDGALRRPSSTSRPRATGPSGGVGRVNLFHMNPPEIALHVPDWRDALEPSVRNVGVPFWELPVVPASWEPVLAGLDAVLAPTRFVESACAGVVEEGRLLHYPQAAFLPDGVRSSREAWGLAPGQTVFVLAFDFRSDVDRKNPWAAIEAFQAAFPGDESVVLLVKTTQSSDPMFAARAEEVRARIGSDPRIRIVDRTLSYPEVLGLYASCDVLLSLHRSEGLGLHLMEAMSLGKAVVATDWSGNTDFMTEGNSVPVGFELVPLRTTHPTYGIEVGRAGQVWAEPDAREAVEAMRRLHADRDWRLAIGVTAERDMQARREDVLSGRAFDALERALGELPRRPWALTRATVRTLGATTVQELIRKGRRAGERLRSGK